MEERKTEEAIMQVCLFRSEPQKISERVKKRNWDEKEFTKRLSPWQTGVLSV